MLHAIHNFAKNYKPKILYIFVDKRINTRFVIDEMNPAPGTVVNTSLVESMNPGQHDFFLIPHKATVATALPVHYRVAHNDTTLSNKQVE